MIDRTVSGRRLQKHWRNKLALVAFALLVHPTFASETLSADEPDWLRGVPRWNGTGYDLPSEPTDFSAPASSTSGNELPYTMPVDPNAPATIPPDAVTPSMDLAPSPQTIPTHLSETTEDYRDIVPVGYPDEIQQLPPPIADPAADETIGSAIEAGPPAIDQPPLEEVVTRWYHYPASWMRGWNSHAEFGIDGSDGNADTLALQTGLEMKRQNDVYTLAIDVDYRQASNRGETTEDNGRFNLDYDRLLGDTSWSAFGKYGMEWDKFKAFDLRINLNGGVGYFWIRDDTTTLATRFGAGASKEIGSPVDDWIPEAVFGIEAERQLTKRQKIKGKVDYFPAWENFGDYRLVTDLAWEILLDGSENLSLKLAATDRYDSTPQGAKANDIYYSLLLLYKF